MELMNNIPDLEKQYKTGILDCQVNCRDTILPEVIKNMWDSRELFKEIDTPQMLTIVISNGMDSCFPFAHKSSSTVVARAVTKNVGKCIQSDATPPPPPPAAGMPVAVERPRPRPSS